MPEYLVKLEAKIGLWFPRKIEASEVFRANSAKQAKEMALAEVKDMLDYEGYDMEENDITYIVTDIKKI